MCMGGGGGRQAYQQTTQAAQAAAPPPKAPPRQKVLAPAINPAQQLLNKLTQASPIPAKEFDEEGGYFASKKIGKRRLKIRRTAVNTP